LGASGARFESHQNFDLSYKSKAEPAGSPAVMARPTGQPSGPAYHGAFARA
jgi:hypothetical protein